MFLPHNLTSSVHRSKKSNKQRTISEGNSESGMMTPSSLIQSNIVTNGTRLKKDKKRGKKKSKNNAAAVATLSTVMPPRSQSLVALGWARISRRGKRGKRESATDILNEPKNDAADIPTSADSQREGACMFTASTSAAPSTANSVVTQQVVNLHATVANENRNIVARGMDKLRRSFRKSFRRAKGQVLTTPSSGGCDGDLFARTSSADAVETIGSGARNDKTYCQPDEAAVRSAVCSFQVKYLGAVEIFHSRGMQVCEDALNILRARKRQTKAILYVTGDSIRVVDQESNRGLIVDQTIEKVSFCAPDRQNEKGFAYICREAASKRWMCHGFHSLKEPGERLSHAVGCAFTVCLEKKKIRDAEDAAYSSGRAMAVAANLSTQKFSMTMESTSLASRSNSSLKDTAMCDNSATFRRQLSIAERRLDPQTAIIAKNNSHTVATSPTITPRSQSDVTAADVSDASSIQATTSLSKSTAQSFSTQFGDSGVIAATVSPTPLDTFSTVKPRPPANPSLFERQGSFKAPVQLANSNAFKRFNSLRTDLIGSTGANRFACIKTLHNEPIYEGDDEALSAELCSLNFENFVIPTGVSSNTRLANANTFTATLPYMSTSQSFGGNGTHPAEFTEEFVRNNGKRASRADEWLTQILQTSTANEEDSSAVISSSSGQQQYSQAGSVASTIGYYNSVTEITPSNSFISSFPHSQSADCFSVNDQSLQRVSLAASAQSGLHRQVITMGSGLSGPPPNQPPPPLPPSVTSTLNDHIPNKSGLSLTTIPGRADKDDSPGFTQTIIKSPSKHEFGVEETNGHLNEIEPAVTPRMSKVALAQRNNIEGLSKTDAIGSIATTAISGHARKSSAARMSIEYELLEETDAPPQSPPRVVSPNIVENDKQVLRLLQITSADRSDKTAELDSFGQCVFNASSAIATVASTTIKTRSIANGKPNGVSTFTTTSEASPSRDTTISPTGAASAEAAIRAIRLATISSLQSAESAISALHNSSKSDDPFDVKWSAEVLQKSTLRKSSVGQCAGNGRMDQHSSIATNNY